MEGGAARNATILKTKFLHIAAPAVAWLMLPRFSLSAGRCDPPHKTNSLHIAKSTWRGKWCRGATTRLQQLLFHLTVRSSTNATHCATGENAEQRAKQAVQQDAALWMKELHACKDVAQSAGAARLAAALSRVHEYGSATAAGQGV